ncbi:MAG TPA: hypothetical protein VFW21_09000 [Mycobacterium sp.]|nr:hypothetical protein [Mycobacterium sp.]
MAPDDEPDNPPWVTAAAGIGAVAVLLGLVVAVVHFSSDWSQPPAVDSTTAPAVTYSQTRSTDRTPLLITPSDTSNSFTTTAPLSTTEITGTPGSTTDSTTPSPGETSPEETTTDETTTSRSHSTVTTTRNSPRFNVTRTAPAH